jgi:hypothetical protein
LAWEKEAREKHVLHLAGDKTQSLAVNRAVSRWPTQIGVLKNNTGRKSNQACLNSYRQALPASGFCVHGADLSQEMVSITRMSAGRLLYQQLSNIEQQTWMKIRLSEVP